MNDGRQARPVRLVLEIDRDRDPLSGRIGRDRDSLEPFVGWTELGSAVSRLTALAPREARHEPPAS